MPFDMFGDVVLTRDVPEHGVRAGDIGTVVERHVAPGVDEEGYSVEFFDMAGNTVAFAYPRASAGQAPSERHCPSLLIQAKADQKSCYIDSVCRLHNQPSRLGEPFSDARWSGVLTLHRGASW